MRREVSCEGDRGKATRVANHYDAVAYVTDDHFAGAKLRLVVDKLGYWKLEGYRPFETGIRWETIVSGRLTDRGSVIY